jgi:hypothetical protein
LQAVTGHEILHWAAFFETLRKGTVEHVVVVGRNVDRGWFYSRHVSGAGWGVEVLLEEVQLNFSFGNKFLIVLSFGLVVHNNTLLKVCVFKMSYWLH